MQDHGRLRAVHVSKHSCVCGVCVQCVCNVCVLCGDVRVQCGVCGVCVCFVRVGVWCVVCLMLCVCVGAGVSVCCVCGAAVTT